MKYCNRCLYPENHPYGMQFNNSGLCMGCIVHEEKDSLDWESRLNKLKLITTNYKERFGNKSFDCIVPVTGGSDSYFTLHVIKNILKMNPLLVYYNSHYNTEIGIRNLANLATVFDCDLITSTLAPSLLKKITNYTLKKYGNMYWQVLAGNSTFPVQIAVRYKIPLIIWGVQGWSEQNGMFSHLDEVEMTERCRKEHCLMGISAEDLVTSESCITRSDIQPFIYPFDNEIEKIGVRGIYLSNYIRWDSKTQHEKMINLYGYETTLQQRTFNNYEDIHCFHSAGIHDYMKFLKLGYSKVTDHATREIRLGRLSRKNGIELINKYQFIVPNDIEIFLEWINLSKEEFDAILDKIRNKKLWTKNASDEWKLVNNISQYKDPNIDLLGLNEETNCDFIVSTKDIGINEKNKYLLMGRGYIDKYNYGALEDSPGDLRPIKRKWKKPTIK